MTSGQAGSPEQPTGQPGQGSGWGQPPQQPPQQPPPAHPPQQPPAHPSAPPPGYPPAPGYAPAPPAGWGGQAPKPVERPVTVRAGIGAFIASVIIGVIGVIVTFTQLDALTDQAIAQGLEQAQDLPANADALSHDVVRTFLIVVEVIALVLLALQAISLWFAWNGRNWARVVLWVIGGFVVLGGLFGLFGGTSTSGFLDALSVIQFLLVLAGVVLLALAPSNEWYRYQRWLKDTGQRR